MKTVTGGYLCFDGNELPEFLRFYCDYMADAPDPGKPPESNDAPGVQWFGGSLADPDDAAIETIAGVVGRAPGNWAFNMGHHMHGAVCRVTDVASPLPRPRGTLAYNVATWWGSAASAARQLEWVDGAAAAMRPHETATYINYPSRDDAASVRESYGDSFARLQAVKRRYDSDNAFRRTRNITPGAG